jgi:4'-phosphopantetheinyl transferase
MLAVLSTAERARMARIRHHEAWRQFVLARGLLRMMLAHCTGAAPECLAIEDRDGEAPCLVHNPWKLHFNVSHSHDRVAVAVGTEAVGVDIERIDREGDWRPLAKVCFHPREQAYLCELPEHHRADAFAGIWTRKEARIKATGDGFRADPCRFSTVPFDGSVRVQDGREHTTSWYTHALAAPAGYRAAIACRSRSSTITMVDAGTVVPNREKLEQSLQPAA